MPISEIHFKIKEENNKKREQLNKYFANGNDNSRYLLRTVKRSNFD